MAGIERLWSHYAEGHRGFAIGLDSENLFFNETKWKSGTPQLQKVHYQPEKPILTLAVKDDSVIKDNALFFTKSDIWSYEREWRAIRRLASADLSIDTVTPTVFLFSFEPRLIKSIVLGARMSKKLRDELIKVISSTSGYVDVEIYQASFEGYEILLQRILT